MLPIHDHSEPDFSPNPLLCVREEQHRPHKYKPLTERFPEVPDTFEQQIAQFYKQTI